MPSDSSSSSPSPPPLFSMSSKWMNRGGYMADPLSPFQLSQNGSTNKSSTRASETKKPLPQKELDFLEKVAADPATSGNFYWDKSGKASHAMTVSAMASANLDKTKNAVNAFQEAKRRRRMREEFTHFCNETSFTALVRIHNASSWMRRIGWILVFVCMLAWLSYQCYWLLAKYFSYPMEVKLDIVAAKELEFPSVSVCNLNPIKDSSMHNMHEFRPLVYYAEQMKDDDVLYDFYYDNYDWLYSTTPFYGRYSSTGPGYTTNGLMATPGGSTSAGMTTLSTTPSSTPSSTPLTTPPGPGSRKKRDIKNKANKNKPPPQPLTNEKPLHKTTNDKHPSSDVVGKSPPTVNNAIWREDISMDKETQIPKTSNEAKDHDKDETVDFVDVDDWEQLEKDVLGEEGLHTGHQRFRRSADRLEMMKNNSFNKWDALDNDNLNTSYYDTRTAEYKSAMAYATISAQMNETDVRQSGHFLNDLLLNCRFNGWQCSPSNFTYFHSFKFGNCFTFNSHLSTMQAKTKFPGPDFGLTLEMYIQQREYVPALAAEAGVRVLIHPKGSAPLPEDNGVSIPPAHSTSISIRKVEMNRLEPPHGTCNMHGSATDRYPSTLNVTYSKLSCLKSCYQNIILTYCNCSLPMYLIVEGTSVCNMTDNDVDDCTSSLPERMPEEYAQCDLLCPQPCHEVNYQMLVSSAAWPSLEYESYLQTKVSQSNYLLMGETEEEDFVKLNVYFTDLFVQKIDQQKAYESQNLISDIGGQLGLWLGLSAITIGELCGFLLSLFRSFTARNAVAGDASDQNGGDKTPLQTFSRPHELRVDDVDDSTLADVKARGYV